MSTSWVSILCLRPKSLCSSLWNPQVPALDPQVDTNLRVPVPTPADCHVAPVTLAALCHLSKADLTCFKLSVAFCPGLAKLGRGRQGPRKGAVETMRGGNDISNKPPGLEVLFISQGRQNFSPW